MNTCGWSNYQSARQEQSKVAVQAQIQYEIDLGHYVRVDTKQYVLSSLGAIPQFNNHVHLIHDLSQPAGGMNKFAMDTSVT
jgi:hypothetical protein